MSRVWLNGALLPAAEARIDPADRGFTLGDGMFETILALAGMPRHAALHLARLRHGASVLGIGVPYDDAVLLDALVAVAGGADAVLRLTLTHGPMARGLLPAAGARPTVLIAAAPRPPPLPPARLIVADSTRRNEFSPLSRLKSLNYGDCILARREAAARGADDAILLNSAGDLADATAATIVLSIGGRWLTPRVADGALPGIARARLLGTCLVTEARIGRPDAMAAQSALLVNSLGARRVASIATHMLDTEHAGLDTIVRELDA